jgi:hypothetical protein
MDSLSHDHHMPALEAMLAGTLALMTGHSQFLQAALNPVQRLQMGEKVSHNLALLAQHPRLSGACRQVLAELQTRWALMAGCTRDTARAAPEGLGALSLAAPLSLQ